MTAATKPRPGAKQALAGEAVRTRITVTGVVQGVGFRPFVHRLATELGVTGFVGNDAAAVFIEAQGSPRSVSEFTLRLSAEPPPLAADLVARRTGVRSVGLTGGVFQNVLLTGLGRTRLEGTRPRGADPSPGPAERRRARSRPGRDSRAGGLAGRTPRRHRMSPAVRSDGALASRECHTSPEEQVLDRITTVRKRHPRLIDEVVTLAHGAGGKSSAALVDAVFVEAFRNPELERLGDGAVLALPSGERLAFSTDSFVVSPLRFPGGSIGHLAVHGTVNDLAVSGAVPRWLSVAFVIEEGFAVRDLRAIAADMAVAADRAGVTLVTGDTKVVPKGAADGLYVTTAGVGIVPAGRELSTAGVRPGDKVLLSGTLADHGMAVMLARGDLGIEGDIRSDTAPVSGAVEALLAAAPGTRWMRDPTRGGLGTVCNELAVAAGVAVILEEEALPVTPLVQGLCDLLGIDPMYVASEGKFAAVVPADEADGALATLRAHPLGRDACVIGEIRAEPEGVVALRNAFGGTRIVDMLVGDPLPRIC